MDNNTPIIIEEAKTHFLTPELVPAQLWFGPHDHLLDQVMEYLCQTLCPKKGCKVCINCRKIKEQQHHAVLWIHPEKQYTLDDISDIFSTIAFALSPDEHFFFILQKADFLTAACANALLKSMEEPPAGYHFILLAERQEQILPTIRSRCIIKSFYVQDTTNISPLFHFFATFERQNPIEFASALEQSKINERETIELLDALMAHWIKQFKIVLSENNEELLKKTEYMISMFKKAYEMPPMPGSSKIFWKNLFLMVR